MLEENYIEIELNDLCEYLDAPVCCHPDIGLDIGETSESYCLKCEFRKLPIKAKAISLLLQLMKLSSNTGYVLSNKIGFNGNPKTRTEDQKLLCDLLEMVQESEEFLKALNIKIEDINTKE